MSYEVEILKDSISPDGVRLTTYSVVFPRFILAEVNTHRMLSRNSASSRAIPTERIIQEVVENPFVPIFNKRVKGMGVGALLDDAEAARADLVWRWSRNRMVEAANELLKLDVDKSRANRLLEPFMWHTAVISATEWGNFFALRTDEGAQPEFRTIATMMQDAYWDNDPEELGYGEWHIPLVSHEELWGGCHSVDDVDWYHWAAVAVGRLARYSSYNRKDPEPIESSLNRHGVLTGNGHWSPAEHVATPILPNWAKRLGPTEQWSGNFRGWRQYRKGFKNEHDFSLLVRA